jgi:hypothetical protein
MVGTGVRMKIYLKAPLMLQDFSIHRDRPVKNYHLAIEFAEPCLSAYRLE